MDFIPLVVLTEVTTRIAVRTQRKKAKPPDQASITGFFEVATSAASKITATKSLSKATYYLRRAYRSTESPPKKRPKAPINAADSSDDELLMCDPDQLHLRLALRLPDVLQYIELTGDDHK